GLFAVFPRRLSFQVLTFLALTFLALTFLALTSLALTSLALTSLALTSQVFSEVASQAVSHGIESAIPIDEALHAVFHRHFGTVVSGCEQRLGIRPGARNIASLHRFEIT